MLTAVPSNTNVTNPNVQTTCAYEVNKVFFFYYYKWINERIIVAQC